MGRWVGDYGLVSLVSFEGEVVVYGWVLCGGCEKTGRWGEGCGSPSSSVLSLNCFFFPRFCFLTLFHGEFFFVSSPLLFAPAI